MTQATTRVRLTLPRLASAELRNVFVGSVAVWEVAVVLVLAVVSGAVAGISALHSSETGALAVASTAIAFVSIPVQLLAISIGTDQLAGEFARGTIAATLAVAPRRGLVFAAKSLATSTSVIGVGLVAGAVSGGTAMLFWMLPGRTVNGLVLAGWLTSTAGLALGAGILAWLVLALGALTRQRVAAMLVPIAVLYIVPLSLALFTSGATRDWLQACLPSAALNALMAVRIDGGMVTIGLNVGVGIVLTLSAALLVLAAWCALVVPCAALTFVRRDLSSTSPRRAPSTIVRRAVDVGRRQSTPGPGVHRSTGAGRVRSELIKSWSLPSVRWLFVAAIVIETGFGIFRALTGSVDAAGATPAAGLAVEYGYALTGGVGGTALILAVIAGIQIAGEFESGTAIPTFIAAPRRWQVTLTKLTSAWLTALAFALPGLLLAGLVVVPLYASRGYPLTAGVALAGAICALKAVLFLMLTMSMCAGIAGVTRRSVATILSACALLVVGPALLNTVLGFARSTDSPLVAIGNAGRFLPWEGARFFYPAEGNASLASVDLDGVLHVSALFGILITAFWAVAAVVAWFAADIRRPIRTR